MKRSNKGDEKQKFSPDEQAVLNRLALQLQHLRGPGRSQAKLAEESGVSLNWIKDIERGKSSPTVLVPPLAGLSSILGRDFFPWLRKLPEHSALRHQILLDMAEFLLSIPEEEKFLEQIIEGAYARWQKTARRAKK